MTQAHFDFMADQLEEKRQRKRAAAILHRHWHQGQDHDMTVDLGIWGRLAETWGMERLNDALEQYEGPPASLRMVYKRGNRHILQRLDKRARQDQALQTPHVSDGLKSFAREILAD